MATHQHSLFPVLSTEGGAVQFLHLQCSGCNHKFTAADVSVALREGANAEGDVARLRETLNRQSQQMDAETRRSETAEIKLETCCRGIAQEG